MNDLPTLFDAVDEQLIGLGVLEGPGQARRTDPPTSSAAAKLVRARATSARVLLLEAFSRCSAADVGGPDGVTDEQAAVEARLPLTSEYATRCSELTRMGALELTGETRPGRAGPERVVRRITPLGRSILRARAHA